MVEKADNIMSGVVSVWLPHLVTSGDERSVLIMIFVSYLHDLEGHHLTFTYRPAK